VRIKEICQICGTVFVGGVLGGCLVKNLWLAKYRSQRAELETASRERDLLYSWLLLKEKGVNLTEYFEAHGLKTVAILSLNRIGRRFYDELNGHDNVCAMYGVEAENFGAVHEMMMVYRLGDDPLPPADCLVICDLEQVSSKREAAKHEFLGEIVTLTEILEWILKEHQIRPRDGAIEGWP